MRPGPFPPFVLGWMVLALVAAALFICPAQAKKPDSTWRQLEPGLALGVWPAAKTGGKLVALKIDPEKYELVLLSADEQKTGPATVKQWARAHSLTACTNASMYQGAAPLMSTGYMTAPTHENNPYINPGYGAFLVFDPKQDGLAPVRLIDRHEQPGWRKLLQDYSSVIQNYRIVSHNQQVVWKKSEQGHGISAVALDKKGNVLFLLCSAPLTVHDFANLILRLPLSIHSAMYTEGGPEASLFIQTPDFMGQWTGSRNSAVWIDSEVSFWPLPNVLGVRKKISQP